MQPPPPLQCVDHLIPPSCPYAPHHRPSTGFHRNYMVPRARFRVRVRSTRVPSRCTRANEQEREREREREGTAESVLRRTERTLLQQRGDLALQITIALGAAEEQPQEDTTTTTTKRTRRIAVREEKKEREKSRRQKGRERQTEGTKFGLDESLL